jgi:hypothetical protein
VIVTLLLPKFRAVHHRETFSQLSENGVPPNPVGRVNDQGIPPAPGAITTKDNNELFVVAMPY